MSLVPRTLDVPRRPQSSLSCAELEHEQVGVQRLNSAAVGVDEGDSGVCVAELIAALSLGTDLGLGQPVEHVLRMCVLALGLAERFGLDESERSVVYYVALLAWVGCCADSFEQARWFGDDIAARADYYPTDLVGLNKARFVARHVGGW